MDDVGPSRQGTRLQDVGIPERLRSADTDDRAGSRLQSTIGINGGCLCTTIALRAAAANGDSALVTKLLSGGTDINAVNSMNRTALYLAARLGHVDTVKVLLQHGAALDTKESSEGLTPLHVAAWYGHTHVVQLLLQAGAAVDAWTSYGCSALHLAVTNRHVAVAQVLCKYMTPQHIDAGIQATTAVCKQGQQAVVGLSAPFMSTLLQHTELMAVLLKAGADPTLTRAVMDFERPLSPLHYAALADANLAVVEVFLHHALKEQLTSSQLFQAAKAAAAATLVKSEGVPNSTRASEETAAMVEPAQPQQQHKQEQQQQWRRRQNHVVYKILQAAVERAPDPDSVRDALQDIHGVLSAAMISSLISNSTQSEADMQAREAEVAAEEADVAAERIAVQYST